MNWLALYYILWNILSCISEIRKEVTRLTEDMLEDSGSEYSPSEDESELSDSSNDSDIKPLDQVKTPSRKSALPPVTPQRKRRGNLSNYVWYFQIKRFGFSSVSCLVIILF
jgi:hypothetical protein